MNKKISVIIVNFNGVKWLSECLSSLKKQTYHNYEVIVVDNGSTDKSVGYIKHAHPWVRIVETGENLGFADGNNMGVKKAQGDYYLLLNNDTKVDKNFLKNFVQAFDKYPKAGIVQSKIVWMDEPNKIDSCGSFWTDYSFLYYFGNSKNTNLEIYNKPRKVFSVKGASMMIKKEIVDKIGLFDREFFNYYEETDLCHRAWLSGYEVWYWPNAVCAHAVGGTSLKFPNYYIQYHNFKNKLASFIKNFEGVTLMGVIPIYLFLNIVISFTWLLKGKIMHFWSLYKSILWNILNISSTMKKRKTIQSKRINSDKHIFEYTKRNPSLMYFYLLLNNKLEIYKDKL